MGRVSGRQTGEGGFSLARGASAALFVAVLALWVSAAAEEARQPRVREESLAFLRALLSAPGPSGYEQPVQRVWRDYVRSFADEVTTDRHGNVIAAINPGGSPRVMLAAHSDEVGFLINYIDDDGFLHFLPIGSHEVGIVPGRRVLVHTAHGPVRGVIGRKAVHLMTDQEIEHPEPAFEKYWIDIAAKNKAEADSLVAVGDPVTYEVACEEMRNGIAVSRAFDDRAGMFVIAEALRMIAAERRALRAAVYAVSTVQEETNWHGGGARTSAFGIDPDIGIAVDACHATDSPDIDKRKVGDTKLGGGPVIFRGAHINPVVCERLREAARKTSIPHQVTAAPEETGTDTDPIQLTRAGVASGLVGIPLRYMHTPVEMIALSDVERSVTLLAAFCLDLTPNTDLIPK